MREIKFRAWSKEGMKYQGGLDDECTTTFWEWYENHKCSFPMQYIGLNDKHGKPIYEGDIVTVIVAARAKIIFKDCRFQLDYFKVCPLSTDPINFMANNIYGNDLEVIGNIYENPELLEAK